MSCGVIRWDSKWTSAGFGFLAMSRSVRIFLPTHFKVNFTQLVLSMSYFLKMARCFLECMSRRGHFIKVLKKDWLSVQGAYRKD